MTATPFPRPTLSPSMQVEQLVQRQKRIANALGVEPHEIEYEIARILAMRAKCVDCRRAVDAKPGKPTVCPNCLERRR